MWPAWTPEDHLVANESLRTQAKRLRIHASVIGFLIGSDEAPPDPVITEEVCVCVCVCVCLCV